MRHYFNKWPIAFRDPSEKVSNSMNRLLVSRVRYQLMWIATIASLMLFQPQRAIGQDKMDELTPNKKEPTLSRRTLDEFRDAMKLNANRTTSEADETSTKPSIGKPSNSFGGGGMSGPQVGMGMSGSQGGMGGPGGAPGMGGPPPTEKQLLAQLIHTLRARLGSNQHDRATVEKQLRAALQKYFDADMEERVKEFDKVKARLASMEAKLEQRLNRDQEIIELQLKQMLHKADGLDFSIPSGETTIFGELGLGGGSGRKTGGAGMGGSGMNAADDDSSADGGGMGGGGIGGESRIDNGEFPGGALPRM